MALERAALANMESLLEADSTVTANKAAGSAAASAAEGDRAASKRKLKKDRQKLKKEQGQQEAGEPEDACPNGGEVTWDEDQELHLLTQMGWSQCMGSTGAAGAVAGAAGGTGGTCESCEESAAAAAHELASAASQLEVEVDSTDAVEAARLKLQLSAEEWTQWEQRKAGLLEERQRMREQLKQRFEEFCDSRPQLSAR